MHGSRVRSLTPQRARMRRSNCAVVPSAGSTRMAAIHASPACGLAWQRSNARASGRAAGIRTCSRKDVWSARAAPLCNHSPKRPARPAAFAAAGAANAFPNRAAQSSRGRQGDVARQQEAARCGLGTGYQLLQAALCSFWAKLSQVCRK